MPRKPAQRNTEPKVNVVSYSFNDRTYRIDPSRQKVTRNPDDNFISGHRKDGEYRGSGQKYQNWLNEHPAQITGWRPTCSCGEEKTVPAHVLDPFGGSMTTAIVAENLYRTWTMVELNPEYIEIGKRRLKAKANIDQVNWLKDAENPLNP